MSLDDAAFERHAEPGFIEMEIPAESRAGITNESSRLRGGLRREKILCSLGKWFLYCALSASGA